MNEIIQVHIVHRYKDNDYLNDEFLQIEEEEVNDILNDRATSDEYDEEEEEDPEEKEEEQNNDVNSSETEGVDEDPKVTYTTRRGRKVKLREDIYFNYSLMQKAFGT